MNNTTWGDARLQYYETVCGGTGAGKLSDGSGYAGTGGVHSHMTNSRLTDPEVLEWRFPVVVDEFRLREGSGGAGRFPGGDGVSRRIRLQCRSDSGGRTSGDTAKASMPSVSPERR
jgi:5-oxoprolinase (ATP-hydrolysing)